MSAHDEGPDGRWVAIVDDDESIRRSLARVLLVNGIPSETFRSAEAYLDRAPHRDPRCLVVDVHLDGMTGFELRERLAAAGRTPPIVFLTAMEETAAELDRGVAGHDFLRKPFSTLALLALLHRHLRDAAAGAARQSVA